MNERARERAKALLVKLRALNRDPGATPGEIANAAALAAKLIAEYEIAETEIGERVTFNIVKHRNVVQYDTYGYNATRGLMNAVGRYANLLPVWDGEFVDYYGYEHDLELAVYTLAIFKTALDKLAAKWAADIGPSFRTEALRRQMRFVFFHGAVHGISHAMFEQKENQNAGLEKGRALILDKEATILAGLHEQGMNFKTTCGDPTESLTEKERDEMFRGIMQGREVQLNPGIQTDRNAR